MMINDQAEPVPPTNQVQEQYQESSNKVLEESDSDKINITTTYDMSEVETMVDVTPSPDNNNEIENFNEDIISTTTTITTTGEDNHQPSSTTIKSNEFVHRYDDLKITREMLYNQRQENRYLINEIRKLRGLDPQTIKIPHEKEEEEIEDEKINLSFLSDTERIAEEIGGLNLYDEVIEFIEHWDQMKRLFRELVEIDLYKTLDKSPNEKLSIQDAIYNVLDYLENDIMGCGKKLKFPDGLARYISQYFIDQETELYLKIKFQTPRINDDTLGFNEWRKELAKTPKQRREDKKLFLEQLREDRKRRYEQLSKEEESKED